MDYEYLNACRMQSGLTNKAIAVSKNLSESTVSRFFHGEIKDPSGPLAAAICDAIGASLDRAFGLVRPVDSTMTEPTPDLTAVATDVIQALPPLVDPQKVANQVVEVFKDSQAIDPEVIAKAVVAALPPHDCDSCRSAQLYEASILRQSKLISVLLGAVGSLIALLVALVVWLLAK